MEADEDGLRFDAETVEAERISEGADYDGVRVTFIAYLEREKIPIQIDIGFGDIVTLAPSETAYPALLEPPSPRLLAYPKETVIAEKLEAFVKLGIANTRIKDFHGLEMLSHTFALEGQILAQAIQKTFQKRGTDLPMAGLPFAFTSEFYDDVNKKRQWAAVCAKNRSFVEKAEFKAVMEGIRNFLALPVRAVQAGHSFTKTWKPGGPWR